MFVTDICVSRESRSCPRHVPQHLGRASRGAEIRRLFAYFAAGAGDKSANISTPVR